jgi:hypothetical protein
MLSIKKLSLVILIIGCVWLFGLAQEKVIAHTDEFTTENDNFTIVVPSPKTRYRKWDSTSPLSNEVVGSQYIWNGIPGSLVLNHNIYDKSFFNSEQDLINVVDKFKRSNPPLTVISETTMKQGDYWGVKLVLNHERTGKQTFYFYGNGRDGYVLYGFSKLRLSDDEDPVVIAMNTFKIIK